MSSQGRTFDQFVQQQVQFQRGSSPGRELQTLDEEISVWIHCLDLELDNVDRSGREGGLETRPVVNIIFIGMSPVRGRAGQYRPTSGLFSARRWPCGVKSLGTGFDAIEDGVAAPDSIAAVQHGSAVRRRLRPAVRDKAPGIKQRRWAQDILDQPSMTGRMMSQQPQRINS
jgi:hypothetical protein